MENFISFKALFSSVVFSFLGLVMLGISFWLFDKLTPGELWHEILEKQNLAAAIVVAALTIGISIIVGLAIH
ncbi:MAG: DUF350 domain-containing protein [Nitrospirae bacterium]|nr:MAG: DUF350 domain-containing protein [Nitrospirota bacterium]